MTQCDSYLSNVKLNFLLVESSFNLHIMKQLSTRQIVHDEINSVAPLKNELHRDNKRVGDL